MKTFYAQSSYKIFFFEWILLLSQQRILKNEIDSWITRVVNQYSLKSVCYLNSM